MLVSEFWRHEVPGPIAGLVIERNIDVHMSALRRKLEDYGDRLLTIRGVGYKFLE